MEPQPRPARVRTLLTQYVLDPDERERRFAELLAILAPSVCLLPRLAVAILIIFCLAALTLPAARNRLPTLLEWRHPALLLPLALLAYLSVNASWAIDPAEAYLKVVAVLTLSVCALVTVIAVRSLDSTTVRRGQIGLALAFSFVLAVIIVGWLTDRAFMRTVYNLFPFFRPDEHKLYMVDGDVVFVGMWELNRVIGLTALLLWPTLLIVERLYRNGRGVWYALGLFAFGALVVAISFHLSSQLALIGSVLVFGLGLWSLRFVRFVLAVFWCLSFLLVVPVATSAYQSLELHKTTWLPKSARARVILWGETAARVRQAPWLGVGIRSTRFFDDARLGREARIRGQLFGKRTGRHAHNIYLQSWFELGAVGAALVMACGVALIFAIGRLPTAVQAHAYATFAVFAIMAAFSWGMWQTWLLAGWGHVIVYSSLAAREPPEPA